MYSSIDQYLARLMLVSSVPSFISSKLKKNLKFCGLGLGEFFGFPPKDSYNYRFNNRHGFA